MVSNKARALMGSDHNQRLLWRVLNHSKAVQRLLMSHCPDIAPTRIHGKNQRSLAENKECRTGLQATAGKNLTLVFARCPAFGTAAVPG